MDWINAKWEHPEKDGAYMVRLAGSKTEQKGWFILRKRMWVAMDGSVALNVKEFQPKRLEKPEWETANA